eukprot:4592475-Pyramimonas_sp.AAC.1
MVVYLFWAAESWGRWPSAMLSVHIMLLAKPQGGVSPDCPVAIAVSGVHKASHRACSPVDSGSQQAFLCPWRWQVHFGGGCAHATSR